MGKSKAITGAIQLDTHTHLYATTEDELEVNEQTMEPGGKIGDTLEMND